MKHLRSPKVFYGIYIGIIFAFFYLPIAVTMFFSFNSSKSLTHFTGFSLRWYVNLITDREIVDAVWVSISIAILATLISTILGTLTSIGISKCRRIIRELLMNINNVPMMNPDIVTAIGFMILFSSLQIPKGYYTMLLAHITFCTPYVITSVYPKIKTLDPNLADVAMDLGATPFHSYFVTGNGVSNISIIVYNMTKRTNPTINALSVIVILVIFLTMFVVRFVPYLINKKKKGRNHI